MTGAVETSVETKNTDRSAVTAAGVSKRFRQGNREVAALRDVHAVVRKGVVTGLVGPDAAGKTTLIRILVGLLLPDSGTVSVLDVDVARNPLKVQSSLGYMPQRFGLYEDLTIHENMELYADLQGVPAEARKDRYGWLLAMTGLAPFTKRLGRNLSGGMKQKLGLMCALVGLPVLLILDEPTVGVDPLSRRELWAIIHQLVEERGTTVFLSTSYLDEAEHCGDVIMIHEGKILGQGSPDRFTGMIAGRTFAVRHPTATRRSMESALLQLDSVLDATIQGDGVRVVMDETCTDANACIEKALPGAEIFQAPSRFGDSFVAILKETGRTAARPQEPLPFSGKNHEGEKVIQVREVSRRFGDFYAVKDVSFAVEQGEIFGLLGANGAGKSTTFRMLCGLLPPTSGTLQVADHDIRRAPAKARSRIGYMAQRFSLYTTLTVRENLRFFGGVYDLRGERRNRRVEWALEEFDLSRFADMRSGELSLGYKQRLSLAAALLHEPDILFLDEPTSGVDPLARKEFWYRINALAETGVTVLVTTHFMEEAEYCDRLVIMANGKILAAGTPQTVKDSVRSQENPEPGMEDAFVDLIRRANE